MTPIGKADDHCQGDSPSNEVKVDPFDPASLRLSQDFGAEIGVQKLLLRVPVRKPNKQEFVRVHPDAEHRLDTALLELKEEREVYLVAPQLRDELFDEIRAAARLFTTINRQGIVNLWPCWLPGPDGRSNSWHETALQAAELAMARWLRIKADMSLGGYQTYVAVAEHPEPNWPRQSFKELLEIAFGERFITDAEHPVLRRLRGAA